MRRQLLIAACLAATHPVFAATPAGDEIAANWFEATIADTLRQLHPGKITDRARYMACGYVAPALTRDNAEAASEGADSAFAEMLEHLRAVLRQAGQ